MFEKTSHPYLQEPQEVKVDDDAELEPDKDVNPTRKVGQNWIKCFCGKILRKACKSVWSRVRPNFPRVINPIFS